MIVISSDVVLSEDEATAGITGDNPRIGWQNIVTEDNITASQALPGFPESNLANPETHVRWKAVNTDLTSLNIALDAAELVNYFGIVGHNLGSTVATIQLQGSDNNVDWVALHPEQMLADDHAFMYEFADAEHQYYRLYITPGSGAPEISVLYVGAVLRMQRRLYVGHAPMTLSLQSDVSSGFSEEGQFLGRVLRSQKLETQAQFKHLTASWYRNYFLPFAQQAMDRTFFFAWRPASYPNEVGYCWFTRDPSPDNQLPNGMMQLRMDMQGIR
jgi:hypothetical protein